MIMENSTPYDRLIAVIEHLGFNKSKFEKLCGLSNGYINTSKTYQRMSESACLKICKKFPQINKEWLALGIGNMLTDYIPADDEDIELYETEEVVYPILDTPIVKKSNLNLYQYLSENEAEIRKKTAFEVIGTQADYIQVISTNAMVPAFFPGDEICINFMEDESEIKCGDIYMVDTRQFGTIVRKVYKEDDFYILKAFNKDFCDLRIHKNDIFKFGNILRSLRSFFCITQDVDYITAINTRDKQIDNMITLQDKLIDEIKKQNERTDILIQKIVEKWN
jgi:hypothetical protein